MDGRTGIDLKVVAKNIVDVGYQDIGYDDQISYVYNTLKILCSEFYEKGGEDMRLKHENFKQKSKQKLDSKFKIILDELQNTDYEK